MAIVGGRYKVSFRLFDIICGAGRQCGKKKGEKKRKEVIASGQYNNDNDERGFKRIWLRALNGFAK